MPLPTLLIMTAHQGDRMLLACRKAWLQGDKGRSPWPQALAHRLVGAAWSSG